MNRASAKPWLTIALAVACAMTATPPAKAADLPPSLARLARGQDLFLHNWSADDPLSAEGDGLGPVHNAVSCVACHRLGGVGGAGPNENNVDLLTVADSERQRRNAASLPLDKVHPGFGGAGASRTVVLHRFGTIEGYDDWRQKLLRHDRPTRRGKDDEKRPIKRLPLYQGHQFLLSQRNTPALFGAALIDAIPDEVIREVARQQERSGKVTGRVAPAGADLVGKFGWRGQTATLRDFVFGACANELGLEVPDQEQGLDPRRPGYRPVGFDLSHKQCEELLAFVADLPAPGRRKVNDVVATTVNYGEGLFHSIGCAQCHLRRLGEVDGIFSDLLLHDMGSQLADPLPAAPESVLVGRTISGGGYFGGGVVDEFATLDTNVHQEWRTPPLWGAADSAPYLHDGRAATLAAAIALHGGEASASAGAFRSLPAADRAALVAFLQSLTAP